MKGKKKKKKKRVTVRQFGRMVAKGLEKLRGEPEDEEPLSASELAEIRLELRRVKEQKLHREAVINMWEAKALAPPRPPAAERPRSSSPVRMSPSKVAAARMAAAAAAAAEARAAEAAAGGADLKENDGSPTNRERRIKETARQKRHMLDLARTADLQEREQRIGLQKRTTSGLSRLTRLIAGKMRRRGAREDVARAAYALEHEPKLTKPDLPNMSDMHRVRARMASAAAKVVRDHTRRNTTDAFYRYKHEGTVTTERSPEALSPSKRRRRHTEEAEVAKAESPKKRGRTSKAGFSAASSAAAAAAAAAPAVRPSTSPRRFKSVGARIRSRARTKARKEEAAREAAARRALGQRKSDVVAIPWPPSDAAFSKGAARRRGEAITYAKGVELARAGGGLVGINPPQLPSATSATSRWTKSIIVLSDDPLSPWSGGVPGQAARVAAAESAARESVTRAHAKAAERGTLSERLAVTVAEAARALADGAPPPPKRLSARELRMRKRVASLASKAHPTKFLHPDLAGYAKSALIVLHGPSCGPPLADDNAMMFGIDKRTAHLLRTGLMWDMVVLRMVAFDTRSIERFVRSADFLARVRTRRFSIDLSFAQSVDSYIAKRLFRILYKLRPLTALHLNGTGLGDDGVIALCRALGASGQSLETLELRECDIGDKGACALAHAMMAGTTPVLHCVDVAGNKFNMAGGCAIAKAAKMRNVCPLLTSVDLRRTPFGRLIAAGGTEERVKLLTTLPFAKCVRL